MEPLNEKNMWRIARKRASFKKALLSYLLVNSFLWGIYLVNLRHSTYPWPLWVMLGWGLGLAFAYADAYLQINLFSAEKEYEKLKQRTL